MLSMDQVLASEHDFAENIRQVVESVYWVCFKKKTWGKTSSSCLAVICIDSVSDLVRHSQQEGLNTIRQEAEDLTEKTNISNQTIMFLYY